MFDREKVKKGLYQHCEGSMFDRCGECPYYEAADGLFQCRDALLIDCLSLLKEQEKVVHPEPSCEMEYITDCCCDLCGEQLIREDNFCRCCGKRIEWEGR